MTNIELPVSIGEALDKLSILDIKLSMINDERKYQVEHEYNLLFSKMNMYVEKFKFLYGLIKKINQDIWFEMEKLRDGKLSDSEYLNICKQTIIDNDIRFRIKNKINNLSNSYIKEQKGYNKKIISIFIENNDIRFHELIINYYSLIYDETVVCTNKYNELTIKYQYDPTIKFKQTNNNYDILFNFNDTITTISDTIPTYYLE